MFFLNFKSWIIGKLEESVPTRFPQRPAIEKGHQNRKYLISGTDSITMDNDRAIVSTVCRYIFRTFRVWFYFILIHPWQFVMHLRSF